MSYGTDQPEMFRLAASYVDRILRVATNLLSFRCKRRPGSRLTVNVRDGESARPLPFHPVCWSLADKVIE